MDRTIDRLGMGIDERIKELVVALRANGFGTTGSCEGHLDHGLPYPWIDVESPLAEALLKDVRYRELTEKARAKRREGKPMTQDEEEEYQRIVRLVVEENAKTRRQLLGVLDHFYSAAGEWSPDEGRLIAEKRGWNCSRVQPDRMPTDESGRDSSRSWPEEVKTRNLAIYRREIDRFSSYLKEKYFSV